MFISKDINLVVSLLEEIKNPPLKRWVFSFLGLKLKRG
jgi:hypothetical protein